MDPFEGRLRVDALKNKVMSASQAADFVRPGMTIAASGFTPSGYPKVVPMEIAKREGLGITLIAGASVGEELDDALALSGNLTRRYPYQTSAPLRQKINEGSIAYKDMHLSHVARHMNYGFFGDIDLAIVEAAAITEEGLIPTTSVGITPTALALAKGIIIELNTAQPRELEGVHDIYTMRNPPHRLPLPITRADERIGTTFVPFDHSKVLAIVHTHAPDTVRPLGEIDENTKKIAGFIFRYLEKEVEAGRLTQDLLPLQSGVGSVANAVLAGLIDSPFQNLTSYTEVIQDSMLDLIEAGKLRYVSGTSFTPSLRGQKKLFENLDFFKQHAILRPMEISNHPEVIRRIGVIAINTAIEVDLSGHVNSTHLLGSRMMNGIGGSGDFARNAYLSIFTTNSTAKGGQLSSIVPMVSHVDHTEHDVSIIVTEQGLADLRRLSPRERAESIIENCAHPDFKKELWDYHRRALERGGQTPHLLEEALSWHRKAQLTGSMK